MLKFAKFLKICIASKSNTQTALTDVPKQGQMSTSKETLHINKY